jgi:WbqC-like protein family
MIVSIMQPYFFPYIGYFQLIYNCDHFVLLDDVQYIKRGWVNRNRILMNGEPLYITLPVLYAPRVLSINQRVYQLDKEIVKQLIKRIEGAYHNAPYFQVTMPLIRETMGFSDSNVAAFNANLICRIAQRLALETPITLSSRLEKDTTLRREERLIEICRVVGASEYVNPSGEVDLYSGASFATRGITLRFLKPSISPYRQFGAPHVPNLSVIDALMFNSPEQMRNLLQEFSLRTPPAAP